MDARRQTLRAALLMLAVSAIVERRANAQAASADTGPSEPVAILWDAPSACPDADAFFREIAAHTTRVRARRANEASRSVRATIVLEEDRFTGTLAIEDAAGSSRPRQVVGTSCGEVAEALGLIAALALDPNATISKPPPPEPAPTIAAPAASAAPDADAKPSRPSASSVRFALGVQAEGAAIAELVGFGRIFADVELGDRRRWLVPSFRIAGARSLEVERLPHVGRASFAWTLAALEACPLRFALSSVTLRPCAGVAVGELSAEGTGVNDARSRSTLWSAASAFGRLAWHVVPRLAVEMDAGLLTPFTREEFVFDPGLPLYRPPAVAMVARAGASVHFP